MQSLPFSMQAPPKSLCILRLSAVGDVCNAIALWQQLHDTWPNTKITWIVGKAEASLLEPLADLNLIIFDKKKGFTEYLRVWKILRTQSFDALLNIQTALRASILSLGIKSKYKIGFNRSWARDMQYLFTNIKIAPPAKINIVDGFMQFAIRLGIQVKPAYWCYPVNVQLQVKMQAYLIHNKKNIVIAPCSSTYKKDWLATGYIEVCKFLQQQDYNIILVGTNGTRELTMAEQICSAVPTIRNLLGQTTLQELIALISQVNLVLAPDSAAVHIANMLNINLVGLYACYNPQRTGPYNQLEHVVSVYAQNIAKQYKKPIEQLPWATTAKGNDLMQQITATQVIEKIKQVLKLN